VCLSCQCTAHAGWQARQGCGHAHTLQTEPIQRRTCAGTCKGGNHHGGSPGAQAFHHMPTTTLNREPSKPSQNTKHEQRACPWLRWTQRRVRNALVSGTSRQAKHGLSMEAEHAARMTAAAPPLSATATQVQCADTWLLTVTSALNHKDFMRRIQAAQTKARALAAGRQCNEPSQAGYASNKGKSWEQAVRLRS
jgi:hypothetical protein